MSLTFCRKWPLKKNESFLIFPKKYIKNTKQNKKHHKNNKVTGNLSVINMSNTNSFAGPYDSNLSKVKKS